MVSLSITRRPDRRQATPRNPSKSRAATSPSITCRLITQSPRRRLRRRQEPCPALACSLRASGAGPAPCAAAADPRLPDPGRCGRRSRSDHHQAAGAARPGRDLRIPLLELRAVKPGTLLVREWEGMLQRVVVLESGFAWNGVTYESLSKVARAITGTNWNGPRFAVLAPRNIANRAKLVLLMSVAPIAISQGLAAYRLPAPIKRWGSVQPVRSMIPPLPYCRSLTGRAPRRWASASRLHRAHQSRSKLMGSSNRWPFCKWILQILEAILFRSRPHRQDFGGFVRAYHGSDQHGHAQRGYRGARGRQDHDLGCAWLQFGLGYHRRGSTELAPSARASSFSTRLQLFPRTGARSDGLRRGPADHWGDNQLVIRRYTSRPPPAWLQASPFGLYLVAGGQEIRSLV